MTADDTTQHGGPEADAPVPAEPGTHRRTRSWDTLTPTQKRAVVAGGAVQMALLAAAQVDLLRRPAENVRGPKPAWFAANFVNFAGPISYFAFGRRRHKD